MAPEKSSCALKVLVVGATGQLGRHVVAASARLGHPTVALVRDRAPSDAAKAGLLRSFQDAGVTLLKGELYDRASLVSAVKAADVVISTVGERQIADQTRLVDAICEAGNVKRFFPAEFGLDVGRTGVVDVEPLKSLLSGKAAVRRATEAAGIPYTYAVAGSWADLALPTIGIGHGHGHAPAPPTDKAVIAGDGDARVPFVDERDIATYTVLAAGDPRAENRTLRIRPPANTLSRNQLVSLWEEKTGKALEREYIPMDAVLKQAQEGRSGRAHPPTRGACPRTRWDLPAPSPPRCSSRNLPPGTRPSPRCGKRSRRRRATWISRSIKTPLTVTTSRWRWTAAWGGT